MVGVRAHKLVLVAAPDVPPRDYCPPPGMRGYYDLDFGDAEGRVARVRPGGGDEGDGDDEGAGVMEKYVNFAMSLRKNHPGHAAFLEAERQSAAGERIRV